MSQTEVLICGAGPTGLILALWLTRQGCRVRIIDKSKGPGETSRAMAIHARTLELYQKMNMADDVVAAGYKTPVMNIWARGERRARIPLVEAGQKVSCYPLFSLLKGNAPDSLLDT